MVCDDGSGGDGSDGGGTGGGEIGSHGGLELLIALSLKCYNYGSAPPHPASETDRLSQLGKTTELGEWALEIKQLTQQRKSALKSWGGRNTRTRKGKRRKRV